MVMLIWRVSELMEKEADDPNKCIPLNKCLKSAAACGVSIGTVKKFFSRTKPLISLNWE